MSKTIKYYSFLDPVTGNFTKDVGYEQTKEGKRILIREVKGVPTVLVDETRTLTLSKKPRGNNLKELTKEEYDKLDTTGEHPYLAERRAANEAKLAAPAKEKTAKEDYLSKRPVRVLDAQAIADSLKKSNGK